MSNFSHLLKRVPHSQTSPAATLILTLLMAYNVYFFHIVSGRGNEGVSGGIAGWIMFVFLTTVFFLLLYTGDIAKYRRVFFVTSALLLAPAFIAGMYENIGHMYLTEQNIIESRTSFCHIVIPLVSIPYVFTRNVIFPAQVLGSAAGMYGMLIIWLLASIISGKGFCSWICFFGGWEDGFSRLRKKPLLALNPENKKLRRFSFAMLAFTVLATLITLTVVYCEWFCPFKIVTEYAQVVDLKSFVAFIIFVSTFSGLVIVLPVITKKRFQCLAFCPFEAFQSLIDKVSLYGVRIDTEKCTQCMRCVAVCPVLALSREIILNKNPNRISPVPNAGNA